MADENTAGVANTAAPAMSASEGVSNAINSTLPAANVTEAEWRSCPVQNLMHDYRRNRAVDGW